MSFARTIVATAGAALALSGLAAASTIVGTARNDTLRGTPRADRLDGRAGNDKLFGLAGNDVLVGGLGSDILTGGPGADTLRCGPGKDVAAAGPGDQIAADCETVTGLASLAIADGEALEGDQGPTTLSFPVLLSKAVTYPVVVRYASSDGTASAPGDYSPASGSLSFAPGETSKTIELSVIGDLELEPDETLQVTLSSPVDAVIANGSATGTIRNEDVARPRGGRYSGTTSQNRSISFDVSPDASRLLDVNIRLDFTCAEIQVAFPDESFELSGSAPITPKTWAFAISVPISDADVTATLTFSGALTAPGSARGTLRFDMALKVEGLTVHCSSGAVTWSAG